MIDPMDRSKLPATISIVTPQPTMTVAATWRNTLVTFVSVRKSFESRVSASMITSSMPTITSF